MNEGAATVRSAISRRAETPPLRVVRVAEWKEHHAAGVVLTDEDRALLDATAIVKDRRLEIDELRDGLRVRARSWVGVVRLATVELRIVPKLTGDRVALARMIEFACGLEGLRRMPRDASLDVDGDSLLELVALLFVEEAGRVLRRGIVKHYVEREEPLGVVRGRILADRQLLERYGNVDRVFCRYDELEYDVDENRLLLVALRAGARWVPCRALRRSLERLRAVLEPLCDANALDLRRVRRELTYDRLNAHYEPAHRLAWLLLDGLGIDDLVARGGTRSICFLLDMNLLFERFVERVFRRVLPDREYAVDPQWSTRSVLWDVRRGTPFGNVRPDLLVKRRSRGARPLPVDAKYKTYDERKVGPADLYQLLLYASTIGGRLRGADSSTPTAILVYPATDDEDREVVVEARLPFGLSQARVVTLAMPIPAVIHELDGADDGPVCRRIAGLVAKYTIVNASIPDSVR